jgi:hypothetical protein
MRYSVGGSTRLHVGSQNCSDMVRLGKIRKCQVSKNDSEACKTCFGNNIEHNYCEI